MERSQTWGRRVRARSIGVSVKLPCAQVRSVRPLIRRGAARERICAKSRVLSELLCRLLCFVCRQSVLDCLWRRSRLERPDGGGRWRSCE